MREIKFTENEMEVIKANAIKEVEASTVQGVRNYPAIDLYIGDKVLFLGLEVGIGEETGLILLMPSDYAVYSKEDYLEVGKYAEEIGGVDSEQISEIQLLVMGKLNEKNNEIHTQDDDIVNYEAFLTSKDLSDYSIALMELAKSGDKREAFLSVIDEMEIALESLKGVC